MNDSQLESEFMSMARGLVTYGAWFLDVDVFTKKVRRGGERRPWNDLKHIIGMGNSEMWMVIIGLMAGIRVVSVCVCF